MKHQLKLETIERWLKDSVWLVRAAAMNACQGRDVPLDIIERGLKDSDCDVRAAAMNACQGRDVPKIRTIEPPETVYKKCIGGVIVCASIPKDAQVRGTIGGECRSDKAVITDIIGDFAGEKVGISFHDKTTCYFVGDEIEVDNFDLSFEECSTGFHFFCTLEQAQKYNP